MRGKVTLIQHLQQDLRDHPRTCGEKETLYKDGVVRKGSPPHMRGKAHRDFILAIKWRITPAHAGKRISQ